jgi:hypothetical protein
VLGWFYKNNPANVILLLLFAVLVKFPIFLHPHPAITSAADGIFYTWFIGRVNSVGGSANMLYSFLSFILLYTQAIQLNQFFNRHKMTSRGTDFAGMSYLLLTSMFPSWNYFSAPLILASVFLLLFSLLMGAYHRPTIKGFLFNLGLILGLVSFVHQPAIFFAIWLLIAMMIVRPFYLNESMLMILGMLTPFYFYGVYLFLVDKWDWHLYFQFINTHPPRLSKTLWDAGALSLLFLPFLMGGYYVQENSRKMLIQVRKGWTLIFLFLLAALIVPFFSIGDAYTGWLVAIIAFSSFHACTYLYSSLRIIPLLLFWVSLIFVLLAQYASPLWG